MEHLSNVVMIDEEYFNGNNNRNNYLAESNDRHPPPSTTTATGLRNIVKRIQIAARVSKANTENDGFFDEDFNQRSNDKKVLRPVSQPTNKPPPNSSSNSPNIKNINLDVFRFLQKKPFFTKKKYSKGELKFHLSNNHRNELKPFISVHPDINQKELLYIFNEEWQLETPKIITLLISGQSPRCRWKNKKQIENFQSGFVKAAMSTNMWILTNGFNGGATAHICSAIEDEIRKHQFKTKFRREVEKNFPLLISVAHSEDLVYGERLTNVDPSTKTVNIKNNGYSDGQKFELHPYHSHFIIINDDSMCSPVNCRNKDDSSNEENQMRFIKALIDLFKKEKNSVKNEVPLVSILVGGEPEDVSLVLTLIRKKIPVVILGGSGGLADLLAYTYSRIMEHRYTVECSSLSMNWDPEYIEEIVKPSVSRKICLLFEHLTSNDNYLLRIQIRDQIIECVRLSMINTPTTGLEQNSSNNRYFILLNLNSINEKNLKNLSHCLLTALLQSRRNDQASDKDQFFRDFDLIVDWNCAEVANNLLFGKSSSIDFTTEQWKAKFFNVLMRKDREEFVEIFLINKFRLHQFMTPSKLSRLFRMIHHDEFFQAVCWETILGRCPNTQQGKFFIENDLNWLIQLCTGLEQMVNIDELHFDSMQKYATDLYAAERKALTLLCIWAILQNRYKLVKVFWKHSDHPIHLGLIVSMFFERLSWHVADTNLKVQLKAHSKEFADYAVGVLDKCYNENLILAYNVFRESIKEWNYMTAADIAANAQLKTFLAHDVAQKWLTNTFQGNIRFRQISWGFFSIPIWIKVLLCTFLIWPMYVWVSFKNETNSKNQSKHNNEQPDDESNVYDDLFQNDIENKTTDSTSIPPMRKNSNNNGIMVETGQLPRTYINQAYDGDTAADTIIETPRLEKFQKSKWNKASHKHSRREHGEIFVKRQPPLWKMILMMWQSPITKFHTSRLFYLIYLVLISLVALYPNCGYWSLDLTVALWTSLIGISHIRHTCILFIRYPSISIYWKVVEIFSILIFSAIFIVTRIFRIYFYPVYWQKIIIALAVMYCYYRLVSVYFPISPNLGPLLYRMRLMITVDFVNFMRLACVILISNSIIIMSLTHPYQELNYSTISMVLHQGVMSLFAGPPQQKINVTTSLAQEQQHCGLKKQNSNISDYEQSLNRSSSSSKSFYHFTDGDKTEDSWIIYIFVFQYFMILRLIITPLLFSLFAKTATKWVSEVDVIWKFQRYQLVIDFANQLALPDPLSFLYYLYVLFGYFLRICIKRSLKWNLFDKQNQNLGQHAISPEDCLYWKRLATEYLDELRKKSENDDVARRQWDCVQEMANEIEYEKRVLRQMKGKIFELEKLFHSTKWTVRRDNGSEEPLDFSRVSPYAETKIQRYPVARKFRCWQVSYVSYEPVCYSKCLNEFDEHLRSSCDDNLLEKFYENNFNNKKRMNHRLSLLSKYKWNSQQTDPNGLIIDRRCSWWPIDRPLSQHINDNAFVISNTLKTIYQLENGFIPLNPYGRTGIRGKGSLLRWGPNHHCVLIISKHSSTPLHSKEIEFLLVKNNRKNFHQFELIKKYVNNQQEMFKFICQFFRSPNTDGNNGFLFNDNNNDTDHNGHSKDNGDDGHLNDGHPNHDGSIDVKEKFLKKLHQTLVQQQQKHQFNVQLKRFGYWNHPANTDNAWMEADVYTVRIDQSMPDDDRLFMIPDSQDRLIVWQKSKQIIKQNLLSPVEWHLIESIFFK